MGLDNNKDTNNDQMSLFDYQLPKATFVPDTSYDSWAPMATEPAGSKAPRFVTVSALVHAAAVLLIAIMAVPLVEDIKTETITIELEDTAPPVQMARGVQTPPTQGATPAETMPAAEPMNVEAAATAEDIVVAKELPKELPPKALPAKVVKATPKPAALPAKNVAAKTDFKAVPMTIDDIDAPELDKGEYAPTAVASNLDEDLNEDFAKVDNSHKSALDAEKKSMEAMAAAIEAEQLENLNAVAEANREEEERLSNAQNSLREKNASAVAAALASEKAAAARAAAEAQEAKRQAGLAAAAAAGEGKGHNEGPGTGNNGEQTQGSQLSGVPTGVRSLDQLRQMPGNPRPRYDREERRRGDQGEIAFVAYISKEGYPVQFRMKKSTGYRNLDSKTLAALKKWRFYPGQEGWVELPFKWDLKGEVQEDGGLLRGAVSSRE